MHDDLTTIEEAIEEATINDPPEIHLKSTKLFDCSSSASCPPEGTCQEVGLSDESA